MLHYEPTINKGHGLRGLTCLQMRWQQLRALHDQLDFAARWQGGDSPLQAHEACNGFSTVISVATNRSAWPLV